MVEVFKTNVEEKEHADQLVNSISANFPQYRINFDLDDCDRILRIEGHEINNEMIKSILTQKGFECAILDD